MHSRWVRYSRCFSLLLKLLVLVVVLLSMLQRGFPSVRITLSPVEAGDPLPPAGGSWLTFGYDPAQSGVNPEETRLNATTVSRLHLAWRRTLPGVADERPILVRHLTWPDGRIHDVLYLTTRQGILVALDAATGTQLWGRSPPSANQIVTTASPAIDMTQGLVYSYGLDGQIHRYQATTGQERRGNGWPVRVTTMPLSEKVSSALTIAHGHLYVTTASFGGDAPPYQGHVVSISLTTGASTVFNAICADQHHLLAPGECPENQAGIWARPGVIVDPVTGHLLITTSNGPYTGDRGGQEWGDSVLALTSDGAQLVDTYTPAEYEALYTQDQDLGSAAPALLPSLARSRTPLLAVQAGKDGELRLLNRQNLSGQGGPGHLGGALQTLDAPAHCPVLTQPAVWSAPAGRTWVLVTNSCAISGYQVATSARGVTTLVPAWSVPLGATSPLIAGSMLFAATNTKAIVALDPQTGQILWSSTAASARGSIGAIHWESPIVIGGWLYCPDETGQMLAYRL